MRRFYAALAAALVGLISTATTLVAQSSSTAAEEVFHKRFFVAYQAANFTGVPVVRSSQTGDEEKTNGTGGSAFGAGVSFVGGGRWLVQLAYDRSAATFNTWLDPGRTIAFHAIDMTVGYALSESKTVAVIPYFTFAPGWYRQSSWNDPSDAALSGNEPKWTFEGLERSDYTIGFAIGAKLGVLKRFALTAEWRTIGEDTGGGCSGGPNVICIDVGDRPPPKDYATRTSFGLQFYFGRMGK